MSTLLTSFRAAMLALLVMAAGGITYSITGEMSNLAISLIWLGLLVLLLLLYLHFPNLRDFLRLRSTQYGANMMIMIGIFVLILVMISVMSVKYKLRVDLTADKRYSLSLQTIKLLKSLDRDLEAIAFYRSDERTRQAMYDLLQEYSYHSTHFKFWFVDPDKKPAEAAKYGITSYRTTLLRSGDKQETISYESENKITNGLMKILRNQTKTVYFIGGHGENNLTDASEYGYQAAKKFMENEHYQVKELLLVGETTLPPDASLLVISGPHNDLAPNELAKIEAFVQSGGGVLFMLDPAPLPETIRYLEGHGFKINNDIIIDKLIRIMGTNYLTPVVMDYDAEHPLTRDLTNIYTFFPIARSIEIDKDPAKGRYVLARTSSSSWARSKGQIKDDNVEFDEKLDRRGPVGVMAVATVSNDQPSDPTNKTSNDPKTAQFGRILVIGDSNFAGNTHIQLAGNRDLFLNIVNWLSRDESMISIRQKDPSLNPLTMTDAQGKLSFWLAVIIAPSLFLIIGVGVVLRRRQRA
ncbi:MAG: GldG family protein [Magnetococcus sp. YQC-5]